VNAQQLLHWGSPVAAALPRGVAERLADLAGDLVFRSGAGGRRVLQHNLGLVLGSTAPAAAVRGAFRTYARYYLATMRLAHQDLAHAVGAVHWENPHVLASSLAHGRGAVVLSGHLGNWDVLGAALATRCDRMCIVAEPLQPARLFRYYTRMRARHGVEVVPVGDPGRTPVEVLGSNGILGVAADRPFGSRAADAPCGAATLAVPTGAIRLGLRREAALHAAFALRVRDGFVVHVGPDWGPQLRGVPDEFLRLQRAAALFAAALHDIVVRHPEQWCLLHPLAARAAARACEAA
jgi:lauroyl/myristoyl acyltransferase